MLTIEDYSARLQHAGLLVETTGDVHRKNVDHVAADSRAISTGGLFVAIKGTATDGHLFIDKAVKHGATAIVCEAVPGESSLPPGIAVVHVSDSRSALAEIAALHYGDPSREIVLIGVTGTNGKTTTTHLLAHALRAGGTPTGIVGTIAYQYADTNVPATNTTPDALELNRLLRAMLDAGSRACVIEVSSHALEQERVRSLHFDAAVFTNLTRDHLDYHITMDAYAAAKRRLFRMLTDNDVAVFNADDPNARKVIDGTPARKVGYGTASTANVRFTIDDDSLQGVSLTISGTSRHFKLVGAFNAYNIAGAHATLTSLGMNADESLRHLSSADNVPGRFERISFQSGTTAIIDYAHTPDALRNVLKTIRGTKDPSGRLWCIFGCGGDRDREKRGQMGEIAERLSDIVIVTSDNPRSEDPFAIIDEILGGMSMPGEAIREVDRRKAIALAARDCRPGDVILVAGKGHEDYQVIGSQRLPFDDRKVILDVFAAAGHDAVPSNTRGL